jgi:hypothetical protein
MRTCPISSILIASSLVLPAFTRSSAAEPGPNLLENGGFEKGLDGWNPLWTRDPDAGKLAVDEEARHGGARAARIEHSGGNDWSLAHSLRLDVRPGEIYELSAWVRVRGAGDATLCAIAYDAGGKALDWTLGGRSARTAEDWKLLRSRFLVPPGTATMVPRLIGTGPSTVWLDDVILARAGTIDVLRGRDLPAVTSIRNGVLEVSLRTADGAFDAKDLRTGRTWAGRAGESGLVVVGARAAGDGRGLDLRLLDPSGMGELRAAVRIDGERPEFTVRLSSDGELENSFSWPPPLASAGGEVLVLPVNEGIGYPADDGTLPEMGYHLYGGHGLCMPWYGSVAGGGAGWMAIIETADDAVVSIPRRGGFLCLAPWWEPRKGRFGPDRTIRYVFLDAGGHVAMAKRYREHAKATGLFRTLAEKRKAVPAVDLLVGAVNVWCWDRDAPRYCREMQALGIRRILWSNARPPEELAALNAMGVLTSRYDIYQDAMNPENFPRLRGRHSDWTSEAWANDDLMIGRDGEWVRGWEVRAKDGTMIPCGTLCDRQAVAYARKRIPPELATHPYRCRFIDTTTASPWRECYHPKHPMDRSESKGFKMDLLRYVAEECKLVCGSETGHDAAVPYVSYFEGMLSLGPYRVPDSGRDMARMWDEVPEAVARFQTGHGYRLPLWELVYHECVVSQWYWGDYNNKLPSLWDRRDLWNALYGTPPMFMFDRKTWDANRDRFARSYRTAAPVARATGYSEMVSHEWLAPDRSVQRTRFSNGVTVTVNFGDAPWAPPGGDPLPPLGLRVEGVRED